MDFKIKDVLGEGSLLSQRGIVGGLFVGVAIMALALGHENVRGDVEHWFAPVATASIVVGVVVSHILYEALHRGFGYATDWLAAIAFERRTTDPLAACGVAPAQSGESLDPKKRSRREVYEEIRVTKRKLGKSQPEIRLSLRIQTMEGQRMATSYLMSASVGGVLVAFAPLVAFRDGVPSSLCYLVLGVMALTFVSGLIGNFVRSWHYGRICAEAANLLALSATDASTFGSSQGQLNESDRNAAEDVVATPEGT